MRNDSGQFLGARLLGVFLLLGASVSARGQSQIPSLRESVAIARSTGDRSDNGPGSAADCRRRAFDRDRALGNDNRTPSGTMKDDTLTLRLVMRAAPWYPDGPSGCALQVHTFAEEGRPSQIPGPLIRVRAGTNMRVAVRNDLSNPVWLRGMQDRDARSLDSTEIAAGATHVFAFQATAPGMWYYWAGGVNDAVPVSGEDGQLVGAFVVDSARKAGETHERNAPNDRVFVMTRWTPNGTTGNRGFQLNAINGRSWPHTEHLTYTAGDSIRWRVINASDELHMMHLHGFYYRVTSRGDATHDSTLIRMHPITAVTVATRHGEWMSMTWAAERTGNWLFHCHILSHMSADQLLDTAQAGRLVHVSNMRGDHAMDAHAQRSMAGLVLGVTVVAAGKPARPARDPRPSVPLRARVIELFANTRPRVFGDRPGFSFVVQDGVQAPAPDSMRIPGTPLMLTRGEPVAVVVHNRLSTPIAVHWHGIELESYYDGVGGWSGSALRIAPMIAPGDSFVARITPPRAGTFMYHVHSEHGNQLVSGLYAPLLVLEPGQSFDSLTDRVFVIATGGPGADAPTIINGKAFPDTMAMLAGVRYRLRLINITADGAHRWTLRGPAGIATWRMIGRDGWSPSAEEGGAEAAQENTAAGVTRDYEFTPTAPGDYTLSSMTILAGRPSGEVTTVPIRVRKP